jgi:hypothetical protein
MKTYWGVESLLHAFLTPHWMCTSGYIHAAASLPLGRNQGVPQSRSERGGDEKKSNIFLVLELNSGRPARSLVTILTELPQLEA